MVRGAVTRTRVDALHSAGLQPSVGVSNGVPKVSVVIPALNEEAALGELMEQLDVAMDELAEPWEAIFVDDGSTDRTWVRLVELKLDRPHLVAVRLRRNFGKAAALAAGFRQARGHIVVTMDADLQDDPRMIPRLVAKLDEGFDLVSGWKSRRNDPWRRRVLSRIFNRAVGSVTGVRLHDLNCGIKAYRREVVQDLSLYGDLHRFIPVLASFRGFRVGEVPVNHRPRAYGRSRYGIGRLFRGFFDFLTVLFIGRYRYRPLHLFGSVGLILETAGVGICAYLTMLKLSGEGIGGRPLLTLGVLLVIVGVQFFFMGLLSELMTRLDVERSGRRGTPQRDIEEVL
jgi:glycosyltransferase involved in cell wall biosynthesis